MSKRVAIVQSNYIPWRGYFDMINAVDEFILFDDMQFTRRDWRNRNIIKTPQGLHWLTIPVEVKGKYHQKISETMVSDSSWNVVHWNTIRMNYARAKGFPVYGKFLEQLYLGTTSLRLSEINYRFLTAINELLGIKSKLTWSSDYEVQEGKTERLVSLCRQAGATEYISGPAAKDYVEPSLFEDAGIKLSWFSYEGYEPYEQLHGTFEPAVSIVDLLLNTGEEARKYCRLA